MVKRKRNSDEDDDAENEYDVDIEEDTTDLKAVFVDTSLDTHIVVLVSPLLSFSLLKERIVKEHSKCFPDFGEIKIDALKVKREQNYYHLSERMLLRIAFHGLEGWFVFADVAGTPSKKGHPNFTNQKHDAVVQMPKHPHKNFESKVAKNNSSGEDTGRRGKTRKRPKMETTAPEALASNCPTEITPKLDNNNNNNNALKASISDAKGSVLPSNVVEISADGHVADASSESTTDAAAGTDTAKSSELLGQSEGTGKTIGSNLDQEREVHKSEVSRSQDKGFKRKKKDGDDRDDSSRVATLGQGPDIMRNDVSAFDKGKVNLEGELGRINTEEEGTPLTSSNPSGNLNEVSEVNHPGAASSSRAIKTKKKNKKDNERVNRSPTAQQGRVPDMPNSITALESETPVNKRTADEEITKSGDTPSKKKKKKHTSKTSVAENQDMSSHRHNNDQVADSRQEVAEVSQSGEVSKPERCADNMSKSRAKSPRKQKTYLGDSSGLPIKEQANEKTEENDAPETATDDRLRGNGTNDIADQSQMYPEESNTTPANVVSADVAEGTKVDKPKASKKKTKKSNENEKASEVVPQIINNNLEAAGTGETGVESLQPARSSKSEENSELPKKASKNKKTKKSKENEKTSEVVPQIMNDNLEAAGTGEIGVESLQPARSSKSEEKSELARKRSKSKQTTPAIDVPTPAIDVPEIPVTDDVGKGKRADESLLTNSSVSGNKNQSKVGDIEREHVNEISVQAVDAHEADMVNPEKQKAKKSKRKKLDQSPVVDTSSNLMALDKGYESERASRVGHQLQRDVPEAEQMKVIGVESFQPSNEADMLNPEKQKAKKSKRKKLDQSPAVDTSSNLMTLENGNESERTSLVGHQPQSDLPQAKQMGMPGVDSFQRPLDNNPEVNEEILNEKPKMRRNKKHSAAEKDLTDLSVKQQVEKEIQKTVVEQADNVMPHSDVNEAEKPEEVSQQQKHHDDSTEVSKLDNQPANKLKGKKFDLSPSVDTSTNGRLNTSKKKRESERSARVGSELQNDVQESELLSKNGTKRSKLHQASQHEECLDSQSVKVKQMVQPKPTFSANVPSEVDGSSAAGKYRKGMPLPDERNDPDEIRSHEVSSGLAKKSGKPKASKQKIRTYDLSTSKDVESKGENVTASNKNDASVNNSPDGSQLPKSVIKRGRGLKTCSTTSYSTNSKDMNAQVPTGDPVSSRTGRPDKNNTVGKNNVPCPNVDAVRSSETSSLISGSSAKITHRAKNNNEIQKKNNQEHGFKTPSNKTVGVPVNALPQKKQMPATSGGLFGDLSSDSSDGEVERNGSSSSTRTPDDISSSDYSEGESKGEVVTSQQDSKGGRSAKDKTNVTLSALKDMNLESILRSSRRYKKAKLVASQSQMEDGESEPPEFVPDSLAD